MTVVRESQKQGSEHDPVKLSSHYVDPCLPASPKDAMAEGKKTKAMEIIPLAMAKGNETKAMELFFGKKAMKLAQKKRINRRLKARENENEHFFYLHLLSISLRYSLITSPML